MKLKSWQVDKGERREMAAKAQRRKGTLRKGIINFIKLHFGIKTNCKV